MVSCSSYSKSKHLAALHHVFMRIRQSSSLFEAVVTTLLQQHEQQLL
jgi:hypothetical protein